MPTIDLTDDQLEMLAAGLQVALDADENLALLSAQGFGSYEGMPGRARREIRELWAHVDAAAREHA